MPFDEALELRRSLERERVLFQRFEELRKAAAQTRMIFSHDIKNPLAVMAGAADLLSKHLGSLTEERSTKLLGALVSSVDQIQSMVSTDEAKALGTLLRPAVVDLVAVARNVSDVEIDGAGAISTNHPGLVEELLRRLLTTAERRIHVAPEGDWIVLEIPGAEAADPAITGHLLEMLGGNLEGSQLRLPTGDGIGPSIP